jgi:hypothetical protein
LNIQRLQQFPCAGGFLGAAEKIVDPAPLGYYMQFRCGASRDCLPRDSFAPTLAAAEAAARIWISFPGRPRPAVRPRKPEDVIPE